MLVNLELIISYFQLVLWKVPVPFENIVFPVFHHGNDKKLIYWNQQPVEFSVRSIFVSKVFLHNEFEGKNKYHLFLENGQSIIQM